MLNWEGVTDTGEDRGLAEKQPGGGQSWVGHQRAQCQGWPRPPAPSCAGEEELGLLVEKVAWWKGIDSGVLRGVRACPQGRTPRCHPGCWTRSKDGQEAELGKWLLVSGHPEGCGARGASSVGALSRMSRWPGRVPGGESGPLLQIALPRVEVGAVALARDGEEGGGESAGRETRAGRSRLHADLVQKLSPAGGRG